MAIELNEDFVNQVRRPIRAVWNEVSADVGRASNSVAMEIVLDADRLSTFYGADGKTADKLIDDACKLFGYEKVKKFLCKHIKLN